VASYFGKYTGVVKDNRDSDKLGRLGVSVPALYPEDELLVARPALPYGVFFVPELETKVWVEFEGGDSGLPLWTGGQYVQGEGWAPEADGDPPQKRALRTPAGHLLLFNDTSGDEGITLTDGVNGHVVTLSADGVTVEDGANGHAISLASSGVTVESAGGAKVELTSSAATLTAPSGAKVDLTPGGAAVDAGPGIVEVKGSLVKLSSSAAMPVVRVGDQGIGNLGAPVVILGPGNPTVLA
jgi:hypothetical protein